MWDINRQDQKGWTALLLLTQWKEDGGDHLIDLIRCFITHGANLNYRDELGMNVFHLWCGSYQKENLIDLIRLLIDNQIKVNCQDNINRNALQILCRNYWKGNLIEIIRLFIENGCDVTKETRSNVMISNRNVEEFQKVIQLLEQHAR